MLSHLKEMTEFNSIFYLLVKGTAMGKKFAPEYTNIFMVAWEKGVLQVAPKKPEHHYRFLDNIWGIRTHSIEEFQIFVQVLNNFNTSITVKAEIHSDSVNYLDTTIFKGPDFPKTGSLNRKVLFKKTDTPYSTKPAITLHQHPNAGLIKSQLLRFHLQQRTSKWRQRCYTCFGRQRTVSLLFEKGSEGFPHN